LSSLLRQARLAGERLIQGSGGAGAPGVMSPAMEAARQVGLAEGIAAGREQGRREAQAELEPVLQALGAAVRGVVEARDRALEAAEADAVSLALAVADRIVHRHAAEDPDLVLVMVREAIRRTADRTRLTIRVHPDCVARVTAHRPEWLEAMGAPGLLEIVADRRVGRGGAEVSCPAGLIDARLETQLEEARRLARDLEPQTSEPGPAEEDSLFPAADGSAEAAEAA
jgi:flagellar assembly protein FliH